MLCFVLTAANVLLIANAAHVAGLAFGYLLGLVADGGRRRVGTLVGLECLGLGVVASCVYMPWSAEWQLRAVLGPLDEWQRQAEAGDPRAQAMYGSALAGGLADRAGGIAWLRRSAEAGEAPGSDGPPTSQGSSEGRSAVRGSPEVAGELAQEA